MRPHTMPAIQVEKNALAASRPGANLIDASLTHRIATTRNATTPAIATGMVAAGPALIVNLPITASAAKVTSQMNEYDRAQLSSRAPDALHTRTGTLMNSSASPTEAAIGMTGVTKPIRAAQ